MRERGTHRGRGKYRRRGLRTHVTMLCLCVWVCVGSSRLVSPWRNTVSYGPVSFSTFDWGHWQRLRRAACGMWCAASLAAAFNLVSGQSTLIFIYSTYSAHTHTHPYCHRHRHLFGFFVHTQDQPVCYTSISVCVCVRVFYAKSIFNLPAEHLCKYQILTTNTCLLGSPKSSPFPTWYARVLLLLH